MTDLAGSVRARPGRSGLGGYALFAAMLSAAGLPIYIHAPKFFAEEYGLSLASLGAVLAALRLVDVVQDPALGWLAARLAPWRGVAVALGAGLMALSMLGLFAVPAPMPPLAWFALTLTGLFSGFSFLTICFYAQGVTRARGDGTDGHLRLSAWRETGALVGVSVAAVAPGGLALAMGQPFTGFAVGFAGLALLAVAAMAGGWGGAAKGGAAGLSALALVLGDARARRLLLIALVNAAPLAVTSTLFLFFVESRLAAPGWEGPLLLLFFLAAAVSAPLWGLAARRWGAKPVLLVGMALAIVSFSVTAVLGAGDVMPFALVCIASGAALGADMTLMPALFAARLARIAPEAAQGFGLWSFVSKLSLALAALVVLPALEIAGFESGTEASGSALTLLTGLYALLPCILKLIAVLLLSGTRIESD